MDDRFVYTKNQVSNAELQVAIFLSLQRLALSTSTRETAVYLLWQIGILYGASQLIFILSYCLKSLHSQV